MDPHNPEDAQQVVADYVRLLERDATTDQYPTSSASLPYPREVIRQSIQTATTALVRLGRMTDEMADFLEVAYVSLADYVDDELMRILVEYRQAGVELAEGVERGRERTKTRAWQRLTAASSLVGEVARTIAAEARDLREEFQTFRCPVSSAAGSVARSQGAES